MKLTKQHLKCLRYKRFYSKLYQEFGYKKDNDNWFLDCDEIKTLEDLYHFIWANGFFTGQKELINIYSKIDKKENAN